MKLTAETRRHWPRVHRLVLSEHDTALVARGVVVAVVAAVAADGEAVVALVLLLLRDGLVDKLVLEHLGGAGDADHVRLESHLEEKDL